ALSELSTVEILYTGAGVILRGRIESLSESAQIAAVAAAFPKEVQDETELSPGLLEFGQRRLEAWLRSARLTDELRIERIGPSVWVRGHLNQVRSQPVVEKQLRAIFPAVQLEIESLPDNAPTIYFRVYLLELQKKRFHNLGLSWPDLQQSAFRIVTGGIQNLLQLDLTLQMLEGEGSVRVLSNPELVVRAPGEAELFSGGELPIHMQSHFYSNVTWKPFGLTLKLKATHTSGDKVRLDISTEVSRLDNSITQGDVPGFQSNRMKTQVDARFGEPLFLSGLLQQDVRSQAKGLPFLRELPILGLLFGSEDYQNGKSELVAILLPEVSPPKANTQKLVSSFPRGPVPFPRNWLSPEQERDLRSSPNFPWNALQ
ncbi:MAG: hypothetical protein ACXWPM_03235, partial [Bdellovibrionota bacterium]